MSEKENLIKYLDKAIYYGFHLLVFAIPLIFLKNSYDWFDLPKLTLLRVGTIILLGLWAIRGVLFGFRIRRTRLDLPILIFLGIGFVSTLGSLHLPTSLLGKYFRYEGFLTLVNYGILFFLSSQISLSLGTDLKSVPTKGDFPRTIALSATIVALYGLLQYLGYDPIFWEKAPWEKGRSFSTLGNPVFLGGYFALVLPIILGGYFESSGKARLFYGFSFVLCFGSAITTFSRGGWLAALVGLGSFFLLSRVRSPNAPIEARSGDRALLPILITMFLVLILIASHNYLLSQPNQPISLKERLTSIPKISEGSLATRLEIWKTIPKMVAQRPFFGWGLDTFRLVYPRFSTFRYAQLTRRALLADNAHNYFLQLASGVGILGLLAFLVILVVFFWQQFKFHAPSLTPSPLMGEGWGGGSFLSGVIGYLAYLLSGINVIGNGALFWIILSLLCRDRSLDLSESKDKDGPKGLSLQSYRILTITLILLLAAGSSWLALLPLGADFNFARAEEIGSYPGAIDQYEAAIRLNPYPELYHQRLGSLYIYLSGKTGDLSLFKQAIRAYQRGQKINPWELDYDSFLGDAYLRGARWFDPKYHSLAEKKFLTLLKRDPYRADALGNLGLVYLQKGRYQEALKRFERLLKINPSEAKTYFYIGMAHRGLKNKAEAIEAFKKALEINPDFQEARQKLTEPTK